METFRSPGMFRHLNAIGWTIDEYGFCQISCNVLDFTQVGLHTIYDAVRELAVRKVWSLQVLNLLD